MIFLWIRWGNQKQRDHWIPTQKMSRLLMTSCKAVKKMQRKLELDEVNVEAMEEEEHNKQVVAEIRKRWHVAPSWNVEFVAYYHDRAARIKEMQESLAEAVILNNQLKEQDDASVAQFREKQAQSDQCRDQGQELKKIYKLYKDLLTTYDPLSRDLKSPARTRTPVQRQLTSPRSTGVKRSASVKILSCRVCGENKDQHLMTHCDRCKQSYHIYCLTPPLTK